jgi:hypothetical protein
MSKGSSTTEESVKIQRTRHLPWRYRVQPYMTPWLIMGMTYVVAMVTHLTFTGPLALVFLTLMVPGLTLVTWCTWDRRHKHARNAATAFTGGMGMWMILATATSPYIRPILYAYVVGGAFLALTWNIRYAGITPTNKHDAVSNGPVDAISTIKGLKGTVTGRVKKIMDVGGERAEVILNHPGGRNTTADVKRRKDNVAGAYSVDPANVRVSEVPGRGDQTKVTVRVASTIDQALTWQGVSAPGKSISAAPLRTGTREDGKHAFHWITGDDEESRAASATLYTGMTGAGKTEAAIIAFLEMISRIDCAPPVVADPEKLMLSFGHILDMFDVAADGPEQTNQLVSNLPEAMRYRARLLGSHGYHKGWVPECWTRYGIPVQPIHIEEAGGYLSNSADFNKALTLCRALGMPISISLQVAVFRQLQRESRSQFGNSLAFGVREMQDAKFALLDETLRAGADPTRWANNEPGKHYAEVTGVPSIEWSIPCRTFKMTTEEVVASYEASRDAGIARCDEGTLSLLSKGITRPERMIVSVPGFPVPEAPCEDVPDPWTKVTSSEAPTLTMVPALEDLVAEPEDERPPVDAARDLINEVIDDAETSGQREVTIEDFRDLTTLLGRDRTWIYIPLKRLAREGRLERLATKELRYRILPRASREEL